MGIIKGALTDTNVSEYFDLDEEDITYNAQNLLSTLKGKVAVNSTYSTGIEQADYSVVLKTSSDAEYKEDTVKTPVGTYGVYITITGENSYLDEDDNNTQKLGEVEVIPATLTPTLSGTATKEYDGNKTISNYDDLDVSVTGKLGEDEVYVDSYDAEFVAAVAD